MRAAESSGHVNAHAALPATPAAAASPAVRAEVRIFDVAALTAHKASASVCKNACRAIINVTGGNNAANSDAVREAGGIPAIVAALTTHKANAKVCEQACLALRNLMVSNAANKDAVRADTGVGIQPD